MTLLATIARGVTEAAVGLVAAETMRPVLEPVSTIAKRGMERLGDAAMRVAAARHQALAPRSLITGKSFWESLQDAGQDFERTVLRPTFGEPLKDVGEAIQENVFDPLKEAGHDIEKGVFRPIGSALQDARDWFQEHPCESMKAALFLGLGLGTPTSVLAPCPDVQVQQQTQRANWIRWGLIGVVGLGIVWAATR